MRYRRLGNSDLNVSAIALGSWLTYGGGVERERAVACVRTALDQGINFFDTANIYGRGAAEELLGEALAGVPRDSYVVGTKLFFPMTEADRGLSRAQVVKQLDASLRRLRVERVDLYQCHRHDPDTPLEETMEALTEAVRQGKVRYIGFSEWPADRIRAALALPGVERFVSSQPQYSLLWRAPEAEVFPLCAENGIGQIVWSPLGQGVLTGKYRPEDPVPAGSRAADAEMGAWFPREWLSRPVLESVQRLRALAETHGVTPAQLALAWVLSNPNVSAAIVGATRPEQVIANAWAAELDLPAEVLAEAGRIVRPPGRFTPAALWWRLRRVLGR
ncbi:aldo/keto reductase family protein [Azospirillum sp. SYSU D00513]|uniref:aldo/keto reductase family protein n=1 Tax=Azospirillum sp. SYSU D00513 TaxID=2812561 RepID=UPI001A966F92|nr:aldo/keto reductase family protein [Azospirillum sp. SYSU D00513]